MARLENNDYDATLLADSPVDVLAYVVARTQSCPTVRSHARAAALQQLYDCDYMTVQLGRCDCTTATL
eukprot:9148134-Pyramimonas_sp.AAC.1